MKKNKKHDNIDNVEVIQNNCVEDVVDNAKGNEDEICTPCNDVYSQSCQNEVASSNSAESKLVLNVHTLELRTNFQNIVNIDNNLKHSDQGDFEDEIYSSAETSCIKNVSKKKAKVKKLRKKASAKKCFLTMLFALISLVLVMVPLTFGSVGLTFTYEYLPFIGNGELMTASALSVNFASSFVPLAILEYLTYALSYFVVAFFGILIANFVFALILMIFRANFLRVILRIFSIIFGIAIILIFILSLFSIVSIVVELIKSGIEISSLIDALGATGILLYLAIAILSAILIKKQFCWFAKA